MTLAWLSLFYGGLFSVLSLCLYVFLKSRSRYEFWKNLKVPYAIPATTFVFGNIGRMVLGKCHISVILDRIYKSHPDERYVGFYEFFRPNLLIKDPTLIEQVLIKDFHLFHSRGVTFSEQLDPLEGHLGNLAGNRWKMVRTKLTPTFSSGKLKQMTGLMQECAKDLDDHMNEYAQGEQSIDVRETMAKFTTDVIGRCAFGLDFNTLKHSNTQYRKIGKDLITPSLWIMAKNLIRMWNPDILIRLKIKTIPSHVQDFFTNLFEAILTYRDDNGIRRNDFMQLMIDLYKQHITERYRPHGHEQIDDEELKFTDNLLTANIFVFYVAGFETTATTLSYIFYELALNPHVQDKLRDEIKKTIDKYDGIINYDVLREIKYMDMVVSETLRKHSAAPLTSRESVSEYQIPGTSIVIPPKTKITIPIYSIHHDPKYYPEPDKFIPERFSDENIANRPPCTFLPFGDGPRICIGLKFAKLEMKACLICIVPKYQFTVCKKTITPIRLQPRSILYTPSHDITMSIYKLT